MDKNSFRPIAVIGALNYDAYGMPLAPIRPGDSTPGIVEFSAGGVGYNIAKHLARANVLTELMSVLGTDDIAGYLLAHCERGKIGVRHMLRHAGHTPAYLAIHNEEGDMVAAINAMSLVENLRCDQVAKWLPAINEAPLAIMDANMPQGIIEMIAMSTHTPLLFDPVSGFKALRAKNVIGRFSAVKPNALEAKILSGYDEPGQAAEWFLAQGVERVFISLGARGVYYADAGASGLLPAAAMRAPNCTGAGDAMVAGIAMGYLSSCSTKECAESGIEFVTRHLMQQGGVLL